MAPESRCQTNATEFWCHSISGAKLPFADVAPLFEFDTKSFEDDDVLGVLSLDSRFNVKKVKLGLKRRIGNAD
ncbi:hypothetical protein Tco_0019422 [Tanacetum coccineum]